MALAVIVCIVAVDGFKSFLKIQERGAKHEHIVLAQDTVAINITKDYYINLSDEKKIDEFVDEGKRTKGVYIVLAKSDEDRNKIFNAIARRPNAPVGMMLKMLIPQEAVAKKYAGDDVVYGMKVDFSQIR